MPKNLDDGATGYVCCQCNEQFNSPSSFFKTYSGLYAKTGHLPVCKDCLTKLFDLYTARYSDAKKAMQRVCMAYDLYYNESLFDKCNNGTDTTLGIYIRKLNMVQYKGKTFDNTLDEGFIFGDVQKKVDTPKNVPDENVEPEEPEIDPEDIQKWGDGLSPVDYLALNNHYRFLKNANPNCDSNQEIFIIDLCYSKMLQLRAVREGNPDAFSKMSEQYRKSFEKAGLKTVRDASADEGFTFGVNIETIEKYTPAEYYKNKELYRDFDDIGDYIDRFLLRPLRNLMHGTSDRDHEFYVQDEEDVNEYSDEE